MALIRGLLVGITLVALLALPFSSGGPLIGSSVLASSNAPGSAGSLYQDNGDDDSDNDDADNEDSDNEDSDNADTDNDNDDIADDNDNGDDGVAAEPAPAPAAAAEPPNIVSTCVATGQEGGAKLIQDFGSVFLAVLPNQPQDTQVTLRDISPDELPAPSDGIVVSDFTSAWSE
jgi:hypothetical protein